MEDNQNNSMEEERKYFVFFLAYIASSNGFDDKEWDKIIEIARQMGASHNLINHTIELFVASQTSPEEMSAKITQSRKTATKKVQDTLQKAKEYFMSKHYSSNKSEELANQNKEFNKKLYKSLVEVANADGEFDQFEREKIDEIATILLLNPTECEILEGRESPKNESSQTQAPQSEDIKDKLKAVKSWLFDV